VGPGDLQRDVQGYRLAWWAGDVGSDQLAEGGDSAAQLHQQPPEREQDLVRRTRKNRETVGRRIEREVKRQLGAFGIATREEVARLQQRVRALEQAAERSSRPAGAGRRPASSRAVASSGTARTRTARASSRSSATARRGRGSTGSTGSGDTGSGGT
jgi:hypothetical protein